MIEFELYSLIALRIFSLNPDKLGKKIYYKQLLVQEKMNSRMCVIEWFLSPLEDTHPDAVLITQFYFLFVVVFRKFLKFDLQQDKDFIVTM